jgi:murein L,D-transpeptidase YcbB/YkuD
VGKYLRKNIIIGAVIYTIGLLIVMSYSIIKGESNYFEYKTHLASVRSSIENSSLLVANKNESEVESKTSFDNSDEQTSSENSESSDLDNENLNDSSEDANADESEVNPELDSQSQEEEYSDVKFERVLQKGLSGEDVSKLQYLLKKNGYYDGNITGNMGDNTVAALKRFQQSVGEIQDGILGASTSEKLPE